MTLTPSRKVRRRGVQLAVVDGERGRGRKCRIGVPQHVPGAAENLVALRARSMPVLWAVVGTQELSGSDEVHCAVDDVVADLDQEVSGA